VASRCPERSLDLPVGEIFTAALANCYIYCGWSRFAKPRVFHGNNPPACSYCYRFNIAVASVVIDTIGKKKYGFSQISLAVPTNLIDDCVIGIPLAAAVSGVNPFRQWIKQGRGPPLVRLALRTLTAPLIVLLGRETAATLLKIDGLIMPGLIELCTPHLVHALVVGPAEGHRRPEAKVEIAKIFEGSY
jgi:hypothetical protein